MKYLLITSIFLAFLACSASTSKEEQVIVEKQEDKKVRKLSEQSKEYWYKGGGAEITSYKLTQARYGELREGEAVMVFVTEPFSPKANTKADNFSKENIPVMKLNFTKRFNTGVYPYSMMNSSFFPMEKGFNSLKVSMSMQEWCGHVYMELRNKKRYEIENHSYFEGDSFDSELDKDALEDDIWTKIRLNPELIESGKTKMIPSFFYMRLMHKEAKAYTCEIEKETFKSDRNQITLTYPELNRSLAITYSSDFPHEIISWKENYKSGFGADAKMLETTGKKINSIRSKYWNKHDNADEGMRKELGLEM